MKILSFLSKFTFLCNLAFLIFAALNIFGSGNAGASGKSAPPEFDFFKNIIITLGFSAIVVNLLMCIAYASVLMAGKKALIPKWLPAINFLLLLFQFYFYFL